MKKTTICALLWSLLILQQESHSCPAIHIHQNPLSISQENDFYQAFIKDIRLIREDHHQCVYQVLLASNFTRSDRSQSHKGPDMTLTSTKINLLVKDKKKILQTSHLPLKMTLLRSPEPVLTLSKRFASEEQLSIGISRQKKFKKSDQNPKFLLVDTYLYGI